MLTINEIWLFNTGQYPSWPGEEDHQANQWLQGGEWGQGAHIRQTYEQEVAGKDKIIPLTLWDLFPWLEWCIQFGVVCACRTCTQLCRSSTLRESTLRRRWRVACCTEGISTPLSIGSASILKMVTERHHSLGCQHYIALENIRLSKLCFSPYIVCVPDELPEGFSQQMQEENQKSRPRFQLPAQQKPAAPSPKVPTNTRKETTKVCVYKCVWVSARQICAVTLNWTL